MRYGYFDNENREYVISQVDVPVSWTNYLGVKESCALSSLKTPADIPSIAARTPPHHALSA